MIISAGMEFPPAAEAIDSQIIVKFKSSFVMLNYRVSSLLRMVKWVEANP